MNKTNFKNPNAEEIRLRGLYRRPILNGSIELHYKSLSGLVGPDCAYHLYKKFDMDTKSDIMNHKAKKK